MKSLDAKRTAYEGMFQNRVSGNMTYHNALSERQAVYFV